MSLFFLAGFSILSLFCMFCVLLLCGDRTFFSGSIYLGFCKLLTSLWVGPSQVNQIFFYDSLENIFWAFEVNFSIPIILRLGLFIESHISQAYSCRRTLREWNQFSWGSSPGSTGCVCLREQRVGRASCRAADQGEAVCWQLGHSNQVGVATEDQVCWKLVHDKGLQPCHLPLLEEVAWSENS